MDIIDKIGGNEAAHHHLHLLFTPSVMNVLVSILFLAHENQKLYFNSGHEKLTKTMLDFKEGVLKVFIKMHIYMEWAGTPESEDRKSFFEFANQLLPELLKGLQEISCATEVREHMKEHKL
jgi:hypothetical protein